MMWLTSTLVISGIVDTVTVSNATILTALVIQEGLTPADDTNKVEVRLAPEGSQQALEVYVDGTAVDFTDPLTDSKQFTSK